MIGRSTYAILKWSIWIAIYSHSTNLILSSSDGSFDGRTFLSSPISSMKESHGDYIGNFTKSDNNESFPLDEGKMSNFSESEVLKVQTDLRKSEKSSFEHGDIPLRAINNNLEKWETIKMNELNDTNITEISDDNKSESMENDLNLIDEGFELLDIVVEKNEDSNESVIDDTEGNKKVKKKRIKKRKKKLKYDDMNSTTLSNNVVIQTKSQESQNEENSVNIRNSTVLHLKNSKKYDNAKSQNMTENINVEVNNLDMNNTNESVSNVSMSSYTISQIDSNFTNKKTDEKDKNHVELNEIEIVSIHTNKSKSNDTREEIELHEEQSTLDKQKYDEKKENKKLTLVKTKKSKKSSQRGNNKDMNANNNYKSTKRKKKSKKRKRMTSRMKKKVDITIDDSDDQDFQEFINIPNIEEENKDSAENSFDMTLNTLMDESDEKTEGSDIENEDHYDKTNKVPSTATNTKKTDSAIRNDITVCLVTWNLAESACDPSDATFIRGLVTDPPNYEQNVKKQSPDIVLIGGQECENTKPRRSEGHRSRQFRSLAIKNLGRDYIPLAIHSLGGVQCLLFCHRRIHPHIDLVNVADVACGVGNVFHNKGAIGIYLQLTLKESHTPVKMLFVTAHLAAHVKNVQARNDDFWRIISEFEVKSPPRFLPPKDTFTISDRRGVDLSSGANIPMDGDVEKRDGGKHLLNSMDHIFFCGDLNYRVDLPREIVEHSLYKIKELEKQNDNKKQRLEIYRKLIVYDQLSSTIARRDAFPDFSEGQIEFAPTFKFDKGTNVYDTSHKQRIPAWTDRILFKQNSLDDESKKGFGITVLKYDSIQQAMHSDHRPVYGMFRVGMGNKR